MPRLGLEVRAGIHTGECERVGHKLAGLAVNVGARVSAAARPGEVLVSQTVKDLVAGSGIEFSERGSTSSRASPASGACSQLADGDAAHSSSVRHPRSPFQRICVEHARLYSVVSA